jgi:hypothetical protein
VPVCILSQPAVGGDTGWEGIIGPCLKLV